MDLFRLCRISTPTAPKIRDFNFFQSTTFYRSIKFTTTPHKCCTFSTQIQRQSNSPWKQHTQIVRSLPLFTLSTRSMSYITPILSSGQSERIRFKKNICSLIDQGRITEAENAVDECARKFDPVPLDTYIRLFYLLGKRPVWPAGRSFVKSVEKYLGQLSEFNIPPNSMLFSVIIGAFAAKGDHYNAVHYFNHMLEYKIQPTTGVLNSIIKAFGRLGIMEQVLFYYDKMKEYECKPDSDTCMALVVSFCRRKNPRQAKLYFEQFFASGVLPDDTTYEVLFQTLMLSGEYSKITKYFDELVLEQSKPPSKSTVALAIQAAIASQDTESVQRYKSLYEHKT